MARPVRDFNSVPRYSTSIADAWMVVEKMRADGWRFVLCAVPEGFAAAFTKGTKAAGNEPYQESAPLAISRAALSAIRGGSR
jgi:hypothetical protein